MVAAVKDSIELFGQRGLVFGLGLHVVQRLS